MTAMGDRTRVSALLSERSKPGYGLHGNSVTVAVVRHVVVNMESVLADLKGIMGEITTIVDHIDTVTGRTGQHGKAGKNHIDLGLSKHDYGKSLFGNYSAPTLIKTDTYMSLETDSESVTHRMNDGLPSHKVLKVKGVTQHQDSTSSKLQSKNAATYNNGATKLEWNNNLNMLRYSRELNQIAKSGTGMMLHNGAIAIVHPTIINSPRAKPREESKETSGTQKSIININSPRAMPNSGTEASSTQESIAGTDNKSHTQMFIAGSVLSDRPKNKSDLISLKASSKMTDQDFEGGKSKHEDKLKGESTCNRYINILSCPQSDQELSGAKEKQNSRCQFSRKMCRSLEVVAENSETPPVNEYATLDMKYYRDMKGQINSRIIPTSYGFTASTGKIERLSKHSQPCQNQDLMFRSPLMRQSSPRSLCSKAHNSSGSVRSLDMCRGSETKTDYYSTESDADSDSCVEYLDVRSITPDIDWSYLNLVGNGNSQVNMTTGTDTNNAREICKPYNVSSRQKNAETEEITYALDTKLMLEAKGTLNNMTTVCVSDYRITDSPIPIHIFCSEVSSLPAGEYCGYYEAILDAVLENIAGFESFEEACQAIDNVETLSEAYAGCDTEFEDDDWDIGIKSVLPDEYPLSPSHLNPHESLLSGSLEFLDGNQNILPADSGNRYLNFVRDYGNRNIKEVTPSALDILDEGLHSKIREEPSSVAADSHSQDSLKLSATENIIVDNSGAIKCGSTNLNQNVIFRPESINSTELRVHVSDEQAISALTVDSESDRSLTDTTSCPTDGSPMSFSSSEMTYTSQGTDRAESVSDEDDMNSSQEDSVSLSSEIGYDTKLFIHKAKIKKLRREFFLSLYRKFDEREMETEDNYSVTSLDDAVSLGHSLTRLDNNNRDNVSETESYLDNVTGYNKSINTWTAYALVDVKADDMSDSASDVINENNVN